MKQKRYRLFYLPFIAAILFLLYQTEEIRQEQAMEGKCFRMEVSLSEDVISEEMLKEMAAFPGTEKIWPILTKEVTVKVDTYTETTVLQGVDLETYPLTVVRSTGEKAKGRMPLLVAGEDFFEQLQDEYEKPISKRQKEVVLKTLKTRKASIQIQETKVCDLTGTEGEFLGVVKEKGLYMEQQQMKEWLNRMGLSGKLQKVCLQMRGKTKIESAKKSLEEAGFGVVVKES